MNFLWQAVVFVNELKWFIGCWKIASWNLFLNILLYKLSSHIWCFPGRHPEAQGPVSLKQIPEELLKQLRGRRREGPPRPHWGGLRQAQPGSLIQKLVWTESAQQQSRDRGVLFLLPAFILLLPVPNQRRLFALLFVLWLRKNKPKLFGMIHRARVTNHLE